MHNIVIFGAPGAGKGTQSDLLVEHFKLNHISTGDLLRKEIADQTELGKRIKSIMDAGSLVSDDIVVEMIDKAIASDTQGILFDGFPRNVAQAETLDKLMAKHGRTISCMVSLDVPREELIRRMLERAKVSGRSDDNEETIKNRLKEYESKTLPVASYYEQQNKHIKINGVGDVKEISANIIKAIEAK
ncbi:MAG: adenylate kinase [Bacteroidales bacterium]|nr:adenylate kinase [Candidatus Colimorpha onthohippi]